MENDIIAEIRAFLDDANSNLVGFAPSSAVALGIAPTGFLTHHSGGIKLIGALDSPNDAIVRNMVNAHNALVVA